jgi:DNA polymerase, archaea type
VLAAGMTQWTAGERVRVYRAVGERAALLSESREDDDDAGQVVAGARDYDVEYYLRVLRDNFASRLARALGPDDFATVFADPVQPLLFARPLAEVQTILTPAEDPPAIE